MQVAQAAVEAGTPMISSVFIIDVSAPNRWDGHDPTGIAKGST